MTEITRLTEEQCKLVEDNINLAYGAIQKYDIKKRFGHILESDDIEQIAKLALCVAATKYDGTQGAFSTYAYISIRNAIYLEAKKHLSKKRSEYKTVPLDILDNENEAEFSQEYECEGFSQVHSTEVSKALNSVKRRHSSRTIDGIEAIKLQSEGYKLEEIGEMYGVSGQRVSMWINRAKKRLVSDKSFINAVF
ncbi:MAG: sigma-70 family RNA polymerase sigma factor [Defluviitaleaceae bacterium]|nr:sigma-70 family RNA polymerase sigma factor [Defluviitaleaceae bacterium]